MKNKWEKCFYKCPIWPHTEYSAEESHLSGRPDIWQNPIYGTRYPAHSYFMYMWYFTKGTKREGIKKGRCCECGEGVNTHTYMYTEAILYTVFFCDFLYSYSDRQGRRKTTWGRTETERGSQAHSKPFPKMIFITHFQILGWSLNKYSIYRDRNISQFFNNKKTREILWH